MPEQKPDMAAELESAFAKARTEREAREAAQLAADSVPTDSITVLRERATRHATEAVDSYWGYFGDIQTALTERVITPLLSVVERLVGERDSYKDHLGHLERHTLPQLRREIQHHQDGKKRWRDRAEKAEARVVELGEDAAMLAALRAVGVDNWDGYEQACELMDEPADVEPQMTARGLTPKEAMLRLLADTVTDPERAAACAKAADEEREAAIAARQNGGAR